MSNELIVLSNPLDHVIDFYIIKWKDDSNVKYIVSKIDTITFINYLNNNEWGIIPMELRNYFGLNEENNSLYNYLKVNYNCENTIQMSDLILTKVFNKLKNIYEIM